MFDGGARPPNTQPPRRRVRSVYEPTGASSSDLTVASASVAEGHAADTDLHPVQLGQLGEVGCHRVARSRPYAGITTASRRR